MSDECQECGMSMDGGTYHPYAACLMFKACKSSRTVSENLFAVLERGRCEDSHKEISDLKRQLESLQDAWRELRREHGKTVEELEESRAHADALAGALAASLECHDSMTEADGIEPAQIDEWRAALTAYRNREE